MSDPLPGTGAALDAESLEAIRTRRQQERIDRARELVDAALRYAAAGYRVLPLYHAVGGQCECPKAKCQSPGKHPRVRRGAHDASADEKTIRAWWAKWPEANIGLALNGLVVVDEDPRNGGDADALPQKLPDTCTQRSGSGGRHFLYMARPGVRYPGQIAPGIDVKSGAGAFIVVEPSVHASGERYCWLDESEPWR